MEVHAHTHTPRKKWTHYFWEFLMLFLAVFCGFLAEYQLEHKIERDRAKELARNLYNEVYDDSIAIQNAITRRLIKEKACIDFAAFARDSSLTDPGLNFYYAFSTAFVNHGLLIYDPKDGILNQLINSGSLRYFKSSQLQTQIGLLNGTIARLRTRIIRENTFLDFTLRPFQLKHFDNRWIQHITDNGKISTAEAMNKDDLSQYMVPRILHIKQFDRDEAENIALQGLLMFSGTRLIIFKEYVEANHNLLMTLRNEYHIK